MAPELKKSAELYAGCVTGAIPQDEYLRIIKETGFKSVAVKKTKVIELPDNLLHKYLSEEGRVKFKNKLEGIFSITVVGYKN